MKYFHSTPHPPSCKNGVNWLLCRACLDRSIDEHRAYFERHALRLIVCAACGTHLTCVHDVIGAVTPL